jgi:hypothetical protein
VATIVTGTERRHARHSMALAPIGFMISMAVPVAVIAAGIVLEGWGAINWASAVVWGAVATVVFTLFSMMGKAMGMTRMDLLDLLGSVATRPHTPQSKAVGAVVHLMNGAILAVGWAYAARLIGVELNWVSAMAWGAVLWLLALLMMSTMGAVHPAIRQRRQDDPGTAATNFGTMTPVGSLMGHLVWGAVLGLLYAAWPLG